MATTESQNRQVTKEDTVETINFVSDFVWHSINARYSANCSPVLSPYRSKYFSALLGDSLLHWSRFARRSYLEAFKKNCSDYTRNCESYLRLFHEFTKQLKFFDDQKNLDLYSLLYLLAFCSEIGYLYSSAVGGYEAVKRSLYGFFIDTVLEKLVEIGGFKALVKFVRDECEQFRHAYNDAVVSEACDVVCEHLKLPIERIGMVDENIIRAHFAGNESSSILRSWAIEKMKAIERKRLAEISMVHEESELELEDEKRMHQDSTSTSD